MPDNIDPRLAAELAKRQDPMQALQGAQHIGPDPIGKSQMMQGEMPLDPTFLRSVGSFFSHGVPMKLPKMDRLAEEFDALRGDPRSPTLGIPREVKTPVQASLPRPHEMLKAEGPAKSVFKQMEEAGQFQGDRTTGHFEPTNMLTGEPTGIASIWKELMSRISQ